MVSDVGEVIWIQLWKGAFDVLITKSKGCGHAEIV
jgi:hypothetical protein